MTSALRGRGPEGSCPISDKGRGGCVDEVLTRGRGTKFLQFKQAPYVHGP